MTEPRTQFEAPDGGWGWVVCFASFMIQALTIGITYTFGIIFVELLEYFQTTESVTAWIGSIQPALLYFTGLVAGPLIQRCGWRTLAITGSIISAVGFTASAFTPNVYLLYLTYGVLTGVGNGCMYVTSMVCVQHYFSSRRAMATGLAVSGSGVGLLIFGVVSPILLEALGWRWTLIVDAGITLVIGIGCGALFKPLPSVTQISDKTRLLNDDQDPSAPENNPSYGGILSTDKTIVRKSAPISPIKESPEDVDIIHEHVDESDSSCCACRTNRCCSVLREIFDLSLFCNPVFTIFGFGMMMFSFGYHVPYTYTPERAILLGIAPKQASFLVSVMGLANVGFRLLLGWLADRSSSLRFYFAGTALCLGGILNLLMVFFDTYPLLIVYSALFGAFSGSFASLFPVLLVDFLGLKILEKSMGQTLAVGAVAFLFAAPMSGLIIDKTGDIVIPFYVVGAAELFGGLTFFLIKFFLPKYGVESEETAEERVDVARKRRRITTLRISESFA